MDLTEIQEILRKHKTMLKEKFKVEKIGVFGSYVQGEQSPESDIDLLVQFSEPVGWEFLDLKEFLESILGMTVDLVTVNALNPQIKEKILDEVVYP